MRSKLMQRNRFLFLPILAFVGVSLFSCNTETKKEDPKVLAEEHNEAKYSSNEQVTDAQFLVNAAEMIIGQIELGNLAQQQSKTTRVINLGKALVKGHTTFRDELTVLSNAKIVTLPSGSSNNSKDQYKELSAKIGKEFDLAYSNMLVKEHTSAIALFETASTISVDPDVKAWAIASLPILRAYLDQAISCQKACEKE